jgi:predicted enzyme related to lactoylglutathione lyase
VKVTEVVPILNVSDLEASFTWFETLGFSKGWDWCPPGATAATFGAVRGGKREIHLSLNGQGGRGGDHGMWLAIWVDDVDALHARCVSEGVEVLRPPTDMPWGVRQAHVRHPDGHVFRLSQPAPHEHEHDGEHDHDHS